MRRPLTLGAVLLVLLLSVLSVGLALYLPPSARCHQECLLYGEGGPGCICTFFPSQGLAKRQSNFPFRYGKRAARTRKAREPFRYGKRFAPEDMEVDLHDSAYDYLPLDYASEEV